MKHLLLLAFLIGFSSYAQAKNLFHCSAKAEYENEYEIVPEISINSITHVTIQAHKYGNRLILRSYEGKLGSLGNGYVKSFYEGNEVHFIDERNDNYVDLLRDYSSGMYVGRVILEEDFSLLVNCKRL